MVVSGLAHRRAGETDRRVDRLATAIEEANETAREHGAPAQASPAVAGMPLPTGYGLQVRGPAGESILLPVCLPPGFELDSMMLCPEFFAPKTRGGQKEAPLTQPEPADRHGSRIGGTMQYVFGPEQGYSSTVEQAAVEPLPQDAHPFAAREGAQAAHAA
jgi:hypothetical protein